MAKSASATSRPPSGPVRHLSHSARETLLRCGKSFFLARIARAPKRPALWSAGGSAVHEVTEEWDRLDAPDRATFDVDAAWKAAFGRQLAEARRREPNENIWGRSPSEPIEVWDRLGPALVRVYIDWRERSPWKIWITPDGQPAIELDVSGMLPGCPVEIQGYVDRVFHDPVFDRLAIVDLKTGKRPPKTADQFGTYGALLKAKYGVDAPIGVPFMNRKATLGTPYDLAEYTPEAVGETFGEAWKQIQAGKWEANGFPGACFICDVQSACHVKNGPLARIFDPDHPEHPDHPGLEPVPF